METHANRREAKGREQGASTLGSFFTSSQLGLASEGAPRSYLPSRPRQLRLLTCLAERHPLKPPSAPPSSLQQ
eukprot:5203225-Pleurochrysis_carterae.AAC.1